MMKDPALPLWESHHHIRGVCYSFRCKKREAYEVYLNYIIASMLKGAAVDPANKINGISISPKRGFIIIKVWNTDAQKFQGASGLNGAINGIYEGGRCHPLVSSLSGAIQGPTCCRHGCN